MAPGIVMWTSMVLLCVIQGAIEPADAAADATLVPKANGPEVVRATIRKIRNGCVFPNDFGFMLRVAWVESQFGLHPNSFRPEAYGRGIWQLDKIGFEDTKLVNSMILNEVKLKYSVDWRNMTYASENMNVALYNALAARLLLYRKPEAIPPGLEAQASYWKKYYNTAAGAGTVEGFISKVNSMKPCSTVGADLLFILDASGSIGNSDFALMKQVLVEVARKFTIGREATQIAVITYDTNIQELITFGSHSTVDPLVAAINALRYTGSGTNTHLALNLVGAMFQDARPLDKGFPRVVIVLTDGGSNDAEATRQAAERLNAFDWLERYSVGMGSGINQVELQLIAPGCTHVYNIASVSAISALTDELYDVACRSSVALPPPEEGSGGHSRMSGTLAPNTPRNARDTAASRLTGRTYALQVSAGSATLYASLSIENPSSAINDYSALARVNSPGLVFVSSGDLAVVSAFSRGRRDLFSSNSSTNASASTTLYLSIVPTEDSGAVMYQLDAHDGDRRSLYPGSAVGLAPNFLWPGLAVITAMIWKALIA